MAIHPNNEWLFNDTLSSLPVLKKIAAGNDDGTIEFISATELAGNSGAALGEILSLANTIRP